MFTYGHYLIILFKQGQKGAQGPQGQSGSQGPRVCLTITKYMVAIIDILSLQGSIGARGSVGKTGESGGAVRHVIKFSNKYGTMCLNFY